MDDGSVLLLAPLTMAHDPFHGIRQERVARPPAAVHRPPSSNSTSTPVAFLAFPSHLAGDQASLPRRAPLRPRLPASFPTPSSCIGPSLSRDTVCKSHDFGTARTVCTIDLISRSSQLSSSRLVLDKAALCPRISSPFPPGGSRPGYRCVCSAPRRGHLTAHIALHSSPSSLVPVPCSLFHSGAGTSSPCPWSHSSSFSRISKQHSTHPISHCSHHTHTSSAQPSRVCTYQQVAMTLPRSCTSFSVV